MSSSTVNKRPWTAYVDNTHYDFKQEDTINPNYNPPDEYRLQVCQFIASNINDVSIPSLIRYAQTYYDKIIRNQQSNNNLLLQHWCLQNIYNSYFFAKNTVVFC